MPTNNKENLMILLNIITFLLKYLFICSLIFSLAYLIVRAKFKRELPHDRVHSIPKYM